jgi:RsiW-degrading membrane proteinase PrsW (M82 family)
MGAVSARPMASNDRTLAIVAGASIVVSVGAVLARLMGVMPEGLSTLIVIVGAGIGLKVALTYASKAASDASRARVMNLVSTTALAISALTVIASLPRITKQAGMHPFVLDVLAQLWTLALLWIAVGPTRTIGWRAFAGSWLTGFLGITALARFVGTPIVAKLGATSLLAVALWVPITEEILKFLPAALVLVVAMRRPRARPSVLDIVLFAAFTGGGFSVYENATLSRGAFALFANPVLSLFDPASNKGTAYAWTLFQSGHLVHTALITLAVAFAAMYPRQFVRRWMAPAIAIATSLLEHCSQNAIITGGLNETMGKLSIVITLGGRLSTLMLIGGVIYVAMLEWRVAGHALQLEKWIKLSAAEAARRAALLAEAQLRGSV